MIKELVRQDSEGKAIESRVWCQPGFHNETLPLKTLKWLAFYNRCYIRSALFQEGACGRFTFQQTDFHFKDVLFWHSRVSISLSSQIKVMAYCFTWRNSHCSNAGTMAGILTLFQHQHLSQALLFFPFITKDCSTQPPFRFGVKNGH